MTSTDSPEEEIISPDELAVDLNNDVEASEQLNRELSYLFAKDVLEQSSHIDIVDLNLNQAMTDSISGGVKKLKELKSQPQAQLKLVSSMTPGEKIVLCMWIKEMGLLEKIQDRSYLEI